MAQIDTLLRVSPALGKALIPALAELAADPGFARALAKQLAQSPPWRAAMLRELTRKDHVGGANQVLGALERSGTLDDREFDDWIDALMAQGRWGEAYARWIGAVAQPGKAVPLVYNGDFETPISGHGFDWKRVAIPGVDLEFVRDAKRGAVAHVTFRDRRASGAGLRQPLLLGPGAYRFSADMRTVHLRSERGLEWRVTCRDAPAPLAASDPIRDTSDWSARPMTFTVPATGCDGQWLELVNPVTAGSVQQVSGELYVDKVSIQVAGVSD